MKSQSILTDLIQFKDEIFKKIRLLENRLTIDITDKFKQTNLVYESVNNRLNKIATNNDSLSEFIASSKLNIEKTGKLEKIVDKIEKNLYTNEIKMRQITTEIEKLKNGYEKIMYENLQVTSYIGPGCKYKIFSDYIRDSITEINKFKSEREKITAENMFIKTRLDNLINSTLNSLGNNISMCQKYTDRMNNEVKNYLENKLVEINEKNLNLRALINKAEIDNEKNVKNLKKDLEQFQNMREEINNETDKKIIEINLKIEDISQEIKSLKANKIDDNINNNKIIKKALLNTNINNIYNKSPHNNNSNRNISKEKNILNSKEEKFNSEESIFKKDITNEESSRNYEKINPNSTKNKKEKKEESFIIKENNLIKKIINHKNKNENNKLNENNIDINDNNKNTIKSNFLNEKIKSESTNEKKEKEKLITNSSQIISKIKNQRNIFKRNNIKIESHEKKIFSLSNGSSLINLSNQNKKNEENETEIIKSINYNKLKDKKKEIIIRTPFSNESIMNKIKQRNFNSNNLIYQSKSLKNEDIFKTNEEQDKKINFNFIKEKKEQKNSEHFVDCNVIDLHLDKKSIIAKKKLKNTSAKINLNNNNSISEVGMKLSPAFGRTNYHFYIKNKLGESYENLKGLQKMSSLKATLNAAYLSSIKNKIYLNDKGNSFS